MELTEDCRYIIFPFMLLLLSFGGCNAVQGESLVHINSNRIVQVVSERFLSLSIDPEHLLWATPLRDGTLNMLASLSPMFIRIGGPSTSRIKFGPTVAPDNYTISEFQWMSVNEFASRAQADLIVSLNTKQTSRGVWDTRNVVKLISFSNQNRYDIAWQLGYDKYSFGQFLSGTEIGMNAIRLRKILDAFDQYSGSPILAPDVVLSEENIPFLREFVSAASSSIAAIPLQMNAAKSNEEEPLQRSVYSRKEVDNLIYGITPRSGKMSRKPIWIAESDISFGGMSEALAWIRRLGYAAKAGYQVVMRQPHPSTINSAPPDFWASLLYKTLVGREVLDARTLTTNATRGVHAFCHCTRIFTKRHSVLGSDLAYVRGSTTVFGVNMGDEHVKLSLRPNAARDELLHIYQLTASDKGRFRTQQMFLNGRLLAVTSRGELPVLSPMVRRAGRQLSVLLQPGSIFFVVIPEIRSRACLSTTQLFAQLPNLQALIKRPAVNPTTMEEAISRVEPASERHYDIQPNPGTFSASDQKEKVNVPNEKPIELDEQLGLTEPDDELVRYVTFNDDDWLGKFADYLVRDQQNQYAPTINFTSRGKRSPVTTNGAMSKQNGDDDMSLTLRKFFTELELERQKRSQQSQVQGKREGFVPDGRKYKMNNSFFSGVTNSTERGVEDMRGIPPKVFSALECIEMSCDSAGGSRGHRDVKDSIPNPTVRECLENLTDEGEKLVETLDSVMEASSPMVASVDKREANLTSLGDKAPVAGDIINFIMDLKLKQERENGGQVAENRIERVMKEILKRTSDEELAKLTGGVRVSPEDSEEYLASLISQNIGRDFANHTITASSPSDEWRNKRQQTETVEPPVMNNAQRGHVKKESELAEEQSRQIVKTLGSLSYPKVRTKEVPINETAGQTSVNRTSTILLGEKEPQQRSLPKPSSRKGALEKENTGYLTTEQTVLGKKADIKNWNPIENRQSGPTAEATKPFETARSTKNTTETFPDALINETPVRETLESIVNNTDELSQSKYSNLRMPVNKEISNEPITEMETISPMKADGSSNMQEPIPTVISRNSANSKFVNNHIDLDSEHPPEKEAIPKLSVASKVVNGHNNATRIENHSINQDENGPRLLNIPINGDEIASKFDRMLTNQSNMDVGLPEQKIISEHFNVSNISSDLITEISNASDFTVNNEPARLKRHNDTSKMGQYANSRLKSAVQNGVQEVNNGDEETTNNLEPLTNYQREARGERQYSTTTDMIRNYDYVAGIAEGNSPNESNIDRTGNKITANSRSNPIDPPMFRYNKIGKMTDRPVSSVPAPRGTSTLEYTTVTDQNIATGQNIADADIYAYSDSARKKNYLEKLKGEQESLATSSWTEPAVEYNEPELTKLIDTEDSAKNLVTEKTEIGEFSPDGNTYLRHVEPYESGSINDRDLIETEGFIGMNSDFQKDPEIKMAPPINGENETGVEHSSYLQLGNKNIENTKPFVKVSPKDVTPAVEVATPKTYGAINIGTEEIKPLFNLPDIKSTLTGTAAGTQSLSIPRANILEQQFKERLEAFKLRLAESREKLKRETERRKERYAYNLNPLDTISTKLDIPKLENKLRPRRLSPYPSPEENTFGEVEVLGGDEDKIKRKYLVPLEEEPRNIVIHDRIYPGRLYKLVDLEFPNYGLPPKGLNFDRLRSGEASQKDEAALAELSRIKRSHISQLDEVGVTDIREILSNKLAIADEPRNHVALEIPQDRGVSGGQLDYPHEERQREQYKRIPREKPLIVSGHTLTTRTKARRSVLNDILYHDGTSDYKTDGRRMPPPGIGKPKDSSVQNYTEIRIKRSICPNPADSHNCLSKGDKELISNEILDEDHYHKTAQHMGETGDSSKDRNIKESSTDDAFGDEETDEEWLATATRIETKNISETLRDKDTFTDSQKKSESSGGNLIKAVLRQITYVIEAVDKFLGQGPKEISNVQKL